MRARLEPLSPARTEQLRRFEETNRAFFASHVGDRGDDYFARFDEHLQRLVGERESGISLPYLVLDADEAILGRVNIVDIDRSEQTEIGFRVAENWQGRGIARWAVGAALDDAAHRGLHVVRARAATTNLASQRVLQRCGFTPTGPAVAPAGSDRTFIGYIKHLG